MEATARSSPGNQRRRACLPSSVLARAQPLIVRVVFLVPYGSRPGALAACCAWVQLRHCMFNWTLALTRAEMHGVGFCRSSKDHINQHRLFFFFLVRLRGSSSTFQVLHDKKINKHENSNSGLRTLSYSLHDGPR